MKATTTLAVILLVLASGLAPSQATEQKQRLAAGEHYADLNGIRLWYKVVGTGPLLVIQAPGWGVASSYLQNGLSSLAESFTLLFYDPRGSGKSGRPSNEAEMSTSDMVGDLEQLRQYWGLNWM